MSEEQPSRKPRAKEVNLTALQNLKLGNFVIEHWETSKMSCPAFAAYATEKLGFPVGDSHIQYRVNQFGLKFHTSVSVAKEDAGKVAALEEKIAELGDRITDLEDAVKVIKLAAKHNVRG